MTTRCILLLLLPLTLPTLALGYTYIQVGVDSNLLIENGEVYFAQADGTLTVLNLGTGEVLARNGDMMYGATLRSIDRGILVFRHRELAVLDRSTLEVIWETKNGYDPAVEGNRIVSYDGNGLVECRDLATGKVIWFYNLPGTLRIVVQKARVLLFRSATYDGPERDPAVVLLDIKTGQKLLHRIAPPHVHYLKAFFDGDHIYLAAGSYDGQYMPSATRYDSGRPSARFEKMIVWDIAGKEVESIPVPAQVNEKLSMDEAFALAGKVFARGRVWARIEDVPPRREGFGRSINGEATEDCEKRLPVTRFDLADGSVTISVGSGTTNVELKSANGNWCGSLPYLNQVGTVAAVAASDKLIVLGTNFGHVEAINRSNGQSQWMYIFPTIRRTQSFSSPHGMPPTKAEAAAMYRRDNQKIVPESGLMLEGTSEPSHPKVIFDPKPANPYKYLDRYLLAIAWTGVSLPLLLTAAGIRLYRKKRLDVRIAALSSLLLAVVAVRFFFDYGRVSLATDIGFRFAIAVPLVVAAVYGLQSLGKKHWLSGTAVLLAALALGVFTFPAFLHL